MAAAVLGLIPARAGSKGVPDKNRKLLAGKPLLLWTAECALASASIDRVILSSDSAVYGDLAREAGIEVPFLRPENLAGDTTPMRDVIRHALEEMASQGFSAEVVVLLQPTAPFRRVEDVDRAVTLLREKSASSVVSVSTVPSHFHPSWQLREGRGGWLETLGGEALNRLATRRQDMEPHYYRNGEIYAFYSRNILENNDIYGDCVLPLVTPGLANIDSEDDFLRAEMIASRLIR